MGYLSRRGGWLSCHARSLTPFFGHAEPSRGLGKRKDRSSCRGRTISEEFRRQAVDLYESTPGATVRGIAADLRGGAGHATAVARGVRDRQLVRLPLPRRPPTRPAISQATVIAVGVSALGLREILGMPVRDSESTDFWTEFLRSLRQRCLNPTRVTRRL